MRTFYASVVFNFTLIYILFLSKGYYSLSTEIQRNSGERVRFNCSTASGSSVDWEYQKTGDGKKVNIFIGNTQGGGQKSSAYRSLERYRIEIDNSLKRYDLEIDNVTKGEEGFYFCSDISDPESVMNWKLTVIGGVEKEVCSNDVVAVVSNSVSLTFPTAKKDSIQLEHRSVDRSYILHAFRDGKLVNDYYVQSGRFSFSSSGNLWNLLIKNLQTSDAGSFICSEDNGLGRQFVKELTVVDANGVVCSTDVETCSNELNVTCAANYSGNCPPSLQLTADGGDTQPRNEARLITANTVSLMAVVNRIHMPICHITTPYSVINSTCKETVCNERNNDHASDMNIVVPIVVTVAVAVALTVSLIS